MERIHESGIPAPCQPPTTEAQHSGNWHPSAASEKHLSGCGMKSYLAINVETSAAGATGGDEDEVDDPPLDVDSAEHSMLLPGGEEDGTNSNDGADDWQDDNDEKEALGGNCRSSGSLTRKKFDKQFIAVNQRLSEDSEHLDFIRSVAQETAAAASASACEQ